MSNRSVGQEEILLGHTNIALPVRFEREYVKLICRLAVERGLNYSQFARLAFRHDTSPEVKWRQIRNVSKTGKPQRLSLADACSMADALGQYFPALCFQAWEMLRLSAAGEASCAVCGGDDERVGAG